MTSPEHAIEASPDRLSSPRRLHSWAASAISLDTIAPTRRELAPLAKQSLIFALILVSAVLSVVVDVLEVSHVGAMWSGVVVALLGLALAVAIARRPALLRLEVLIPALDFVAIGLLRQGTGDSRSVFLAVVVLPIIWWAAEPGRRFILLPLLGTCVTLLLPFLFSAGVRTGNEVVRLVMALLVYAAVAAVINALSSQAAQHLERVREGRRVAQLEIDRAAVVQQSLLPGSARPLVSEFDVRGVCVSAREVGGDFYDWYATPDGVALTLGDVMGKGVGAGMIAAAVRAVVRSAVVDDDPAEALRRAAAGLTTDADGGDELRFTTCFHARLGRDGTVRWVDAGHGLSLIRTADGDVRYLRSHHLPIGIGIDWTSQTDVLAPGDTLVSISDGVLDLFEDDLHATQHFADLVARHDPADLVPVVTALAAGQDHPDDVTVVSVSYLGQPAAAPAGTAPARTAGV